MNSLVVYSSLTGNTRKVAEAIAEALPTPCDLASAREMPPAQKYDFIAVGFWADRGGPDPLAAQYLKTMNGKCVGLFMTLGADPDSDHARDVMARAEALIPDCEVMGTFACQGKVDPALVERMREKFKDAPPDHPHADTPERRARLAEAAKHPDDGDLANAREAFTAMAARVREAIGEEPRHV